MTKKNQLTQKNLQLQTALMDKTNCVLHRIDAKRHARKCKKK